MNNQSNQMLSQANDASTAIQINADSFSEEESSCNDVSDSFQHGKWSFDEHQLFINLILLNGNDWDKISKIIPTRSINQIRSHALKYFNQLTKKYPERKEEDITHHRLISKEEIEHLSIEEIELNILKQLSSDSNSSNNDSKRFNSIIKRSEKEKYFEIRKVTKKKKINQKEENQLKTKKTPKKCHLKKVKEELSKGNERKIKGNQNPPNFFNNNSNYYQSDDNYSLLKQFDWNNIPNPHLLPSMNNNNNNSMFNQENNFSAKLNQLNALINLFQFQMNVPIPNKPIEFNQLNNNNINQNINTYNYFLNEKYLQSFPNLNFDKGNCSNESQKPNINMNSQPFLGAFKEEDFYNANNTPVAHESFNVASNINSNPKNLTEVNQLNEYQMLLKNYPYLTQLEALNNNANKNPKDNNDVKPSLPFAINQQEMNPLDYAKFNYNYNNR